jgi:multidrug efflux pump subunit AcrA (membrane-fusion protein)
LPKTLTVVGAVLLVFMILIFWQARFTLEAKGTLEPVERQDVFAGVDGMVKELNIVHGATVTKGQLLVKLRSTELEAAITETNGKWLAAKERLANVERQLLERDKSLRIEDRDRLAGERAETKQNLASLEAQLKIQREKLLQLDVRSPIAGVVVTWDPQNRLPNDRPVQRGSNLLRVADPTGNWQLEVHMPENHMGHVTNYQQTLYNRTRERLRELLREAERAKLGEAASQEDVDKAVEEELAQVHDEALRDKMAAVFQQRLRAAVEPILKDVTDEKLRGQLGAVLQAKTYEEARAKLDALLKELQEPPKTPADNAAQPPSAVEQQPAQPGAAVESQPAQPGAAVPQTPEPPKPPETVDSGLLARLQALPREELPNDRLEVTYILATEPGTTYEGTVKEIHRSAEVRGDEGNTVLIKVELDAAELTQLRAQQKLRPGAAVTAKIYCGRRSLGYVLLHDLISFVQSRIMFRFF